jgi:hypothetical protein
MKVASPFVILLSILATVSVVSGHASSCPDANPIMFWKLLGPGALNPPVVSTRELFILGGMPACRAIAYGFNGPTHYAWFPGVNSTNTSMPTLPADPLPAYVDIMTPDNETEPLCFYWSVPRGYNVYAAAATTGNYTVVETYSPTPASSGGPICTEEPWDGVPSLFTLCYVPAVDISFGGGVDGWRALHEVWYAVSWNLTTTPSVALGVVCAPPHAPVAHSRMFRVEAVATGSAPVERVVSGMFDVVGTGDSGAVTARVVSSDVGGSTVVTPARVWCDAPDPYTGAMSCTFYCQLDPTLAPVSVVAMAQGVFDLNATVLDGVACAQVAPEIVRDVRGSDYVLTWDHGTTLDAGTVGGAFPVRLGPFDVRVTLPPNPNTYSYSASLAFPEFDIADISAASTLMLTSAPCQ